MRGPNTKLSLLNTVQNGFPRVQNANRRERGGKEGEGRREGWMERGVEKKGQHSHTFLTRIPIQKSLTCLPIVDWDGG